LLELLAGCSFSFIIAVCTLQLTVLDNRPEVFENILDLLGFATEPKLWCLQEERLNFTHFLNQSLLIELTKRDWLHVSDRSCVYLAFGL
jgi:hypothetical protein